MSFLKISDLKNRDFIVQEYLKTKKNIKKNFLTESLQDISEQRELSKLFKPITEAQKDVKESLLSELKPIKEHLKELPAAITFPQLQAIAGPPGDEDEDLDTTPCPKKTKQTCFCQNFVKFPPISIIYNRRTWRYRYRILSQ